jgi:hypothetical protein
MPAQVQVAVADQIIDLADDYARSIISTTLDPTTNMSPQDLHERVSGAMLTFLEDALALAEAS